MSPAIAPVTEWEKELPMETRLTDLPFDQWVAHVFDHPVTQPAWYFDMQADYWDGPPALTVDYLTRLFMDPVPPTAGHSDAQLNQGLWYIVHTVCSNHMLALLDESVPLAARIDCIDAFYALNAKLFAARCSPHLGHLSEEGAPLNMICYMWWDLIPLTPAPKQRAALDEAVLAVMEQTLALDSLACQEGALHGLGHWADAYPEPISATIDFYLQQPGLRPALRAYAQAARDGMVL